MPPIIACQQLTPKRGAFYPISILPSVDSTLRTGREHKA
ncbi:hypothetical protein TI01_1651 [Lysobacter sp. A03]|nr:hypothetical protein TI01_1651 [Lysobacter sp. A03]